MFIFQYFSQEKRENEFFFVCLGRYVAAEATGRLISVPTLVNN